MNKLSLSYQTIIRLFLQILAVLGLIGAIAWFIFEPGFEPILALLGSITTFLTSFFFNNAETIPPTPLPDECEFMAEIQIGSLEARAVQINESGDVDAFRRDYQEHFGGRQTELAELDNWLTQTETCLGLLVAPAGMGKSALVANWVKRLEEEQTAVVIYHPISLRYGTNSKKQTLFSLLDQMSKTAQKESRSLQLHSMAGLDLIDQYLSLYQVKELCAYLAVNYDDLGQEGKRANSLRLIQRCQRERRIEALVVACQKIRSDLDWTEAFSTFVLEQLDYEPPFVGSDIEALNAQLRSNLRKPARPEKPLLVIVDGLDELEDQLNQPKIKRVDFLPNDVGHNVYVLAVARGETKDREAWQDALRWRETAIRSFHLPKLNQNDIEAMVRRNKLVLDERHLPQLTNQIYGLSEDGDPLIASLWIGWLKDNPFDTIQAQIAFLQAQKPGANKYIEGVLNQLAPVMTESAMPLFEVLSLARGPLTVNDLSALGIGVHSTQLDKLVGLSGRLITQTGTAYVLSHSRLRHAIQDEYVKETRLEWFEKFHRYGRCALKQAQQIPNPSQNIIPDYLLNYYANHLQEGIAYYNDLLGKTDLLFNKRNELENKRMACQESLYALVDQTWMTAHYYHFGHYDNFLRDVDATWEIATLEGPQRIALQVKSALCHAHITSLSNNLPPHLPALLARDEIWTPLQAISHTRRITDLAQQTRTLVALLTVNGDGEKSIFKPYLPDIVSSVLQNMAMIWQQNKVDEEEMFKLQLAILPFLQPQNLKEALPLALNVQRAIHRARLLAELLRLTEYPYQHHPIIKDVIKACGQIDDSVYSEDVPFIISTFTAIAQNLSINQLGIAFTEVWEKDSQAIREQELEIERAKKDPSLDLWQLNRKHSELVEIRIREKRLLDYLAWHIESHQALAFIELLFKYDSLPEVAEKIGRFARRLNDEIAYDVAVRLEEEFASAPQKKRQFHVLGSTVKGVGMAFITLVLSRKGKYQQKIVQIANNYIETYGAEDFPYSNQDLRIFCQMAIGQLADTEVAELVSQYKFMRRFWLNEGREYLSMYSQEIVGYLGIDALKILFNRCTQTEDMGRQGCIRITASPYILPAIAEKLPDEELLSLICKIGYSKGEPWGYGWYGYIRAIVPSIKYMSEEMRSETTGWTRNFIDRAVVRERSGGLELERVVAPYITPEIIPHRSQIHDIGVDIVGYLPSETVSHIIRNFDMTYYGETRGTEVLLKFLRYLPEKNERLPILLSMKDELFQIKDEGELDKTINILINSTKNFSRLKVKVLSQTVETKIKNAYLLSNLKESGPPQVLFDRLMNLDFSKRDIGAIFRAPISLLRHITNQMRLLYLNKSSHKAMQGYKDKLQKQTETPYFSSLDSWPQKLFHLYYKGVSKLASSRLLWVSYLLGKIALGLVLLPISVVIALLMIPLIVLLTIRFIIFALFDITLEWWRDSFQKKPPISHDKISLQDKWDAVKKQIVILNQFPELNKKEAALITIVYTLGDVLHRGSPDYKKYTQNAENIWAELNSEAVADILMTLKHYNPQMDIVESGMEKIFLNNYTAAFSESQTYIRAFIPAIALKNKARLPELIPYIEKPYTQLKAIQYACLAYFLTGQERIDCLQKSVDAFPYAEWPEDIIPYILTWIAEYTDSGLISHLLRWLQKYPSATALAQLAPKIVDNKKYLAQAFAIAQKTDKSVAGFIVNIASQLDKEWTAKAIIWVMQRNIDEEQKECLPSLVERWLKLLPKEIYEVWTDVLKAMKPYPRHRVLPLLSQFAEVMGKLGDANQLVNVAQEMITVSSWWNIVWVEPQRQWRKPG